MKNFIIIGDSYSAFKDIIPEGYLPFYPMFDVLKTEDMWWGHLIKNEDYNLIQNNSWSGSTLGHTGYNNDDASHINSFIYRYRQLKEAGFFEKNKIDTVFVFGGTNDSWANAPLGENKLSNWNEQDLFSVLPAINYMAYTLKNDLPNTEIVFIINTEIKEEIQTCMEQTAVNYKVKAVRLRDIDKESGHPTAKGMLSIYEQVLKVL